MDITKIPFNKFIEIIESDTADHVLELELRDCVKNHLGTFHASAQFALAEACSGLALQKHFPHLENSVVPMLRKSDVKFKKPAQTHIHARARIDITEKEKFEQQLERKGRATVIVFIEVLDQEGTVTMNGSYEWFVQKL
ncbi:MAG: DUF4442 domain-containing protein [Desulfobulbus sp.]|jgi:acyl-coenzyme A thioesterase PaaI-like protein|uniref:YiiD C-terminal domain-containing protein n=1 Tax=Desulfobulbus sp. TaxID=895 RepID=UPI00284FF7D4|nr:YiiD C-terminal domain-containing protein [Desulfobulbus sp.]MDR2550957.1 DUF4442 domain-containing protein [Desulfobulbus sp.]